MKWLQLPSNRFILYCLIAGTITAGLIAWQLHNLQPSYYGTMVDLRLKGK